MVHQSTLVVRAAMAFRSMMIAILTTWLGSCSDLQAQDQAGIKREGIPSGSSVSSLTLNDTSRGELLLCGGAANCRRICCRSSTIEVAVKTWLSSRPRATIPIGDFTRWRQAWADFNWRNIDIVHAESREQAEAESLAEVLSKATAVWISGGDQSRLANRYLGSRVEEEIRGVMRRGGIVGGTSAGSAIVTKIMISGGKLEPRIDKGLDILPKAIVDQHFSQRGRQTRLANAVANHPDRIGIGIDESTGLHITSKAAKVLGQGAVYVYKSLPNAVNDSEETKVTLASFNPKRFEAGSLIAIDDLPLLCE